MPPAMGLNMAGKYLFLQQTETIIEAIETVGPILVGAPPSDPWRPKANIMGPWRRSP